MDNYWWKNRIYFKEVPSSSFRLYDCLPLTCENNGLNEENLEEEKKEERKSSDMSDDRENLYRYLKTIMHERGKRTHNVVVMKEHVSKQTLKQHSF